MNTPVGYTPFKMKAADHSNSPMKKNYGEFGVGYPEAPKKPTPAPGKMGISMQIGKNPFPHGTDAAIAWQEKHDKKWQVLADKSGKVITRKGKEYVPQEMQAARTKAAGGGRAAEMLAGKTGGTTGGMKGILSSALFGNNKGTGSGSGVAPHGDESHTGGGAKPIGNMGKVQSALEGRRGGAEVGEDLETEDVQASAQ